MLNNITEIIAKIAIENPRKQIVSLENRLSQVEKLISELNQENPDLKEIKEILYKQLKEQTKILTDSLG